MTLEEKQAIQTLVIDEIAQRSQEQPTLLIDALLTGQGWALVQQMLGRRLARANQESGLMTHLLKAMQANGHVTTEDAA